MNLCNLPKSSQLDKQKINASLPPFAMTCNGFRSGLGGATESKIDEVVSTGETETIKLVQRTDIWSLPVRTILIKLPIASWNLLNINVRIKC